MLLVRATPLPSKAARPGSARRLCPPKQPGERARCGQLVGRARAPSIAEKADPHGATQEKDTQPADDIYGSPLDGNSDPDTAVQTYTGGMRVRLGDALILE